MVATAAGATLQALQEQADNDEQAISLWLDGRSPHTERAYRADIERLRAFVRKPLHRLKLPDLQEFAHGLVELSGATQARILASVKSLLSFCHRMGYLSFDVGAPLRLPKFKTKLAERILTESDVHCMIRMEQGPRNRALLGFLYIAGLRVSEVCGLRWRDLKDREDGGQLNVYGKGGKTRVVRVEGENWRRLMGLFPQRGEGDEPVFGSQKGGGAILPSHAWRIVKAAAERCRVKGHVSPHWLRHSHASHALEKGAPIHLVQATLGHANLATTGRYLHARPSDSSARFLSI